MAQLQLPLYPAGYTLINALVGFQKRDGRIYYFQGSLPLYSHSEDDYEDFRFITSEMIVSGGVKQAEIVRAFGVSSKSVKRNVKRLREEGLRGLLRATQGGTAHVLTPRVTRKAQVLLDQGLTAAEVGRRLVISGDTIRKALKSGRLNRPEPTVTEPSVTLVSSPGQTKSERMVADRQTGLGLGCTRQAERQAASLGQLNGAPPVFVPNVDVQSAGVMTALPALLANGLLKSSDQHFTIPKGFYSLVSTLITLAFTALLRIKSLEGMRYIDAAELGKTVGLDRIPEVKTLRQTVKHLGSHGRVAEWSRSKACDWLSDAPELAGALYLDGHVRVYHGQQTKLPKRFVSRDRLCLRGVTDYWVNDGLGQPFFAVSKTIDPGLLAVLEDDIVPRLLTDIPNQPTAESLAANPHQLRFGIVFDRQGYSPKFFKKMWAEHRIACYTYSKNVTETLPESDFSEHAVVFANGEVETMMLAERGIYHQQTKCWFREIRKLTESGHQTTILTTDYEHETARVAGHMFARWAQENFFAYMMEHYGIDRLIDYELQETDGLVPVVNPAWRDLDNRIRSINGRLARRRAEFGVLILSAPIGDDSVADFIRQKVTLKEHVESLEKEIGELKEKKKKTDRHITFDQLPEKDKFKTLKTQGKQFIDTIKMIAYRAETAMANIIKQEIATHTKIGSSRQDEARAIIRQVLETDADIEPDEKQGLLKIRLHNMTNPRNNRYIQNLCAVLNESQTLFPGTNLVLQYDLGSNQIPAG